MNSRPSLPVLLDALRPVVRPAMLQEFTPDCCIATCRILSQVFQHYGFYADAVPVIVYIFNAPMSDLLLKGVTIPTDPAARRELFDSTGAWGVGITKLSAETGAPVKGGRFGGHLVLRVMNTLIDASLQQADRPQYRIELPSLIAFTPSVPAFFAHKRAGRKRCGISANNCEIIYERMNDYSFSKSPDWLRTGPPNSAVIRTIIREVEHTLNNKEGSAARGEFLGQRDCLASEQEAIHTAIE